jgi:hypothetical protein
VYRSQRQKLVQGHTQRINIRASVDNDSLAQGLFGAHVPQRAHEVAAERQAVVSLDLRQAEVGDPKSALMVEEQVARLDVAVQDATRMGVVEGLGGLKAEARDVATVFPRASGSAGLRRDEAPGPYGRTTAIAAFSRSGGRACARRIRLGRRAGNGGIDSHRDAPARNQAACKRCRGQVSENRRSSAIARGRFRLQSLGPPELVDDLRRAAPVDVLHHVERHTTLGAHGEDWHDVVVVQAGRRLGLELEALELAGVERCGQREDLERHAAL